MNDDRIVLLLFEVEDYIFGVVTYFFKLAMSQYLAYVTCISYRYHSEITKNG